jgi:hypothetical protein
MWSNHGAQEKLKQLISDDFYDYLIVLWKTTFTEERYVNNYNKEKIKKKLQNLKNEDFKTSVFENILNCLPMKNIAFNTNVQQTNNLHFQNGVLMLDKVQLKEDGTPDVSDAFRERTKNDYVSLILPYSFHIPNSDNTIFFENIFMQIQPHCDYRKFQLDWLAYCLTGITNVNIFTGGESLGSHAKSIEACIHSTCFNIYSLRLDDDIFAKNGTMHRQQNELISQPIRYAFAKTFDQEKCNNESIENFIKGNFHDKTIQAKLNYIDGTKIDAYKDTLRYVVHQKCCFKSKEKYDSYMKTLSVLDQVLKTELQKQETKLDYLWFLLPYVVKLYSDGLVIPEFGLYLLDEKLNN